MTALNIWIANAPTGSESNPGTYFEPRELVQTALNDVAAAGGGKVYAKSDDAWYEGISLNAVSGSGIAGADDEYIELTQYGVGAKPKFRSSRPYDAWFQKCLLLGSAFRSFSYGSGKWNFSGWNSYNYGLTLDSSGAANTGWAQPYLVPGTLDKYVCELTNVSGDGSGSLQIGYKQQSIPVTGGSGTNMYVEVTGEIASATVNTNLLAIRVRDATNGTSLTSAGTWTAGAAYCFTFDAYAAGSGARTPAGINFQLAGGATPTATLEVDVYNFGSGTSRVHEVYLDYGTARVSTGKIAWGAGRVKDLSLTDNRPSHIYGVVDGHRRENMNDVTETTGGSEVLDALEQVNTSVFATGSYCIYYRTDSATAPVGVEVPLTKETIYTLDSHYFRVRGIEFGGTTIDWTGASPHKLQSLYADVTYLTGTAGHIEAIDCDVKDSTYIPIGNQGVEASGDSVRVANMVAKFCNFSWCNSGFEISATNSEASYNYYENTATYMQDYGSDGSIINLGCGGSGPPDPSGYGGPITALYNHGVNIGVQAATIVNASDITFTAPSTITSTGATDLSVLGRTGQTFVISDSGVNSGQYTLASTATTNSVTINEATLTTQSGTTVSLTQVNANNSDMAISLNNYINPNNIIHGNYLENCAGGGIQITGGGANSSVTCNIVNGFGKTPTAAGHTTGLYSALRAHTTVAGLPPDNLTICGNIWAFGGGVNCINDEVVYLGNPTLVGYTYLGNIHYKNDYGLDLNIPATAVSGTVNFNYNGYFKTTPHSYSWKVGATSYYNDTDGGPYRAALLTLGFTTYEQQSITTDPQFIDGTGASGIEGFRLGSSSPYLTAGTDISGYTPAGQDAVGAYLQGDTYPMGALFPQASGTIDRRTA